MPQRLPLAFYTRDVLDVAPDLIGKVIIRKWEDGSISRHVISETEAYRGDGDKACHASKGRTQRTDVMFETGGKVYMYLIYGMYWMLNVVTSVENDPQAVLVRGFSDKYGPGRITRMLELDRSFYGEDLILSERLWIEDHGSNPEYSCMPRIGIDYAGEPWTGKPWRYTMI